MEEASPHTDKREEFLTARQLAAILQVSESTVRRLAREGRIPAIRLTARLPRFHLQSVMHAPDGTQQKYRTRPPPPPPPPPGAPPALSPAIRHPRARRPPTKIAHAPHASARSNRRHATLLRRFNVQSSIESARE